MTYLAAVLDLCIWAGEGFDGLDKWLAMPERLRDLWFEHWSNLRSRAYDPAPVVEKTRLEHLTQALSAEEQWLERCRRKAQK